MKAVYGFLFDVLCPLPSANDLCIDSFALCPCGIHFRGDIMHTVYTTQWICKDLCNFPSSWRDFKLTIGSIWFNTSELW